MEALLAPELKFGKKPCDRAEEPVALSPLMSCQDNEPLDDEDEQCFGDVTAAVQQNGIVDTR